MRLPGALTLLSKGDAQLGEALLHLEALALHALEAPAQGDDDVLVSVPLLLGGLARAADELVEQLGHVAPVRLCVLLSLLPPQLLQVRVVFGERHRLRLQLLDGAVALVGRLGHLLLQQQRLLGGGRLVGRVLVLGRLQLLAEAGEGDVVALARLLVFREEGSVALLLAGQLQLEGGARVSEAALVVGLELSIALTSALRASSALCCTRAAFSSFHR